MQRFAAHFVWCQQVYRMHYIEVDDQGLFRGVFPLEEEIPGTAFYDGVLIPVLSGTTIDFKSLVQMWETWTQEICVGVPVQIIRLSGIPLASAKLGTDHGCRDGHVERL